MTRLLYCLLAGLFPYISWAQGYDVQSGEHEDFSRIVILYPEVPEWQLGRTDGGYEFRPKDPGARYDLAKVFGISGQVEFCLFQ